MFATCSWPSLCEQSELQCWRRNRRLCGSVQISAARVLPLTFDISNMNTLPYRACCRLSATLIFLEFEHPISRGCLLSTTYGGAMRFSFIRTSCKRCVKPLLAYILVKNSEGRELFLMNLVILHCVNYSVIPLVG